MTPRIPRASAPCAQLARLQLHPHPHHPASPAALLRSISTTSSRCAAAKTATQASRLHLPPDWVPPKQPPSARPSDTRKAQLIRSYTSLVRSTPLMLIFQHNNLDSYEWMSIRRELRNRIQQLPAPPNSGVTDEEFNDCVRIQVLRTGMFKLALKIHEFFDPVSAAADPNIERSSYHGPLVHDLSAAARRAVKDAEERELIRDPKSAYAQLSPLLMGPLAVVTIPAVSPEHLAAVLSILAPVPGKFPAPLRRKRPEYWELPVQLGLQKLLLIGGRIEKRIMDTESVRWVGGIEGGLDSMRARVVNMLQNAGAGLTSVLDSAGRHLWFTMEGRRSMLEEEAGGGKNEEEGDGKKEEGNEAEKTNAAGEEKTQ